MTATRARSQLPETGASGVWPGRPAPLGVSWDGAGVDVAVFSSVAAAVEVCLFDGVGVERRVVLPERTGWVWHGYLPGVAPGQRYGLRVHGPFDPARGLWCNPAKLLVDPYARAVEGPLVWGEALRGRDPEDPGRRDGRDSAALVPKAVVIDPAFEWAGDRPPRVPWEDTVIYEGHVKGLTSRHPDIPRELRGTYLGLAQPVFVEHLGSLGVTALELLPVQQFVSERRLVGGGLTNYWGYNPLAWFAPRAGYANTSGGGQVVEFKAMVATLHAAGIEVILDVVFNHSAEGGPDGPTLSLRGLDNPAYYRLDATDPSSYVDYTGTGNTLNTQHPNVLQLIMDCLRYWVTELHVDGFRFDLAAALARGLHDVDRLSGFFDVIQQDPVISGVKLIAEPWDVGPGGYQVGNFPPLWAEWNGRYRDTIRDYWRGRLPRLGELGYRLCGSSDLYRDDGRSPFASINYVTAHDGFTLHDLVSYEHKHNDANGEANRDGTDDNRSSNGGVEGDTTDLSVQGDRARRKRNLLATLLLSHGVPMLLGGDEIGRTQRGNNNAYCQDNGVSWLDWEGADRGLLTFARELAALRAAHPVLRRRGWFTGRPLCGDEVADIAWLDRNGRRLTTQEWETGPTDTLVVFLNGAQIAPCGYCGEHLLDDDLLLVFCAAALPVAITLPGSTYAPAWDLALTTAPGELPDRVAASGVLRVPRESVSVLVHRRTS